jgi:hypothetical protein
MGRAVPRKWSPASDGRPSGIVIRERGPPLREVVGQAEDDLYE